MVAVNVANAVVICCCKEAKRSTCAEVNNAPWTHGTSGTQGFRVGRRQCSGMIGWCSMDVAIFYICVSIKLGLQIERSSFVGSTYSPIVRQFVTRYKVVNADSGGQCTTTV